MMWSVFAMPMVFASIMPDYAIGWGTLSLINAGLAQSKNRGALFWFIISLFLGPIATLLIVLFPDNNDPPKRKFLGDFE